MMGACRVHGARLLEPWRAEELESGQYNSCETGVRTERSIGSVRDLMGTEGRLHQYVTLDLWRYERLEVEME